MLPFACLKDVNLKDKRVLVRVDFNVPLSAGAKVSDDSRIRAALPTIKALIEQEARIILVSHLGRPKGQRIDALSLRPVATVLADLLERPVIFVDDCIGTAAQRAAKALQPGCVLMLENVRFHQAETKNDPAFAKELASLAEAYVNDAFGTAHRAHASTQGVTQFLSPCVAGKCIEREVEYLGAKTNEPRRPYTVILGGAKVSDKIAVIDTLLDKADNMLIGGAMAYTFMLAQGKPVGKSLVEPDKVDLARKALEKAKAKGVCFLLPEDHVCTDEIDWERRFLGDLNICTDAIPEDQQGVDIGPKTIERYSKVIEDSQTVLWNGPMGIFELQDSAKGTFAIAEALAHSQALSIVGGGDSSKAIHASGVADSIDFISTGGGASLEFLEGKELPGLAALDPAKKKARA